MLILLVFSINNKKLSLMSNPLSNRITQLTESATLKMAALGRALKQQGVAVIDLSLGEPDFDTPTHIKEAAKQAIDQGYNKYTPVSGYLDLREAIALKFKRDNNLTYTPDQIVASTGAKQSIINVVLAIVNPGDEVLLPAPYWVSYAAMTELAEGIPIEIKGSIENNFKITPQQLELAISPKSKLIIFSSPCNPTGSVYSKSELKALAEVIAKYPNLYVISDEIYEFITYSGKHESIAQFDFIYDRVITVNGLSKAFAMTGWRLGYIGAPLAIAKACDKMQGQYTSGTCSITQRAAIAALTGNLTPTFEMRNEFLKRRDLILSLLKNIKGVKCNTPEGAFYVFPDVTYYIGKKYNNTLINNVDDLSLFLLNDAHVSTVGGGSFGDPDCIRISYANSSQNIKDAIAKIAISLDKLN